MSVRNLDVLMDRDLSLRSHIARLTGACFRALRQARAIRRSLRMDASRLLISSAMLSRIDYCNCIFAGLPDFNLDRLLQVMNAAHFPSQKIRPHIRLPTRPPLAPECHNASNLNCVSRCTRPYTTFALSYLAEQCIPVTAVATRKRLRSSAAGNLVVPKIRSEFGKRGFSFVGPHAWNNWPQTIKSSTSVVVFKKHLKISFQTMLQTLMI